MAPNIGLGCSKVKRIAACVVSVTTAGLSSRQYRDRPCRREGVSGYSEQILLSAETSLTLFYCFQGSYFHDYFINVCIGVL
jgi:hypothetical protein